MPCRLALVVSLLAAPLAAGTFETSGTLALGATDLEGGQPVAAIDLTFSLPIKSPDLTIEAGTFAYVLRAKRPHETYVALAWRDSLRAGVVRPAYDSVLPGVFEQAAPYLAYDRAEFARAYTTTAAMRRTAVPWGLSHEGQSGALSYALSLHSATKGGFRSASVALDWQGAGWHLAFAAEAVDPAGTTAPRWNVKLGGAAQAGPVTFGMSLLHPEASDRPDTLALDIAAPLGRRLTLHALGEHARGGRADAFGLAAEADLGHDRSLQAAATRADRATGLHLGLTQRF